MLLLYENLTTVWGSSLYLTLLVFLYGEEVFALAITVSGIFATGTTIFLQLTYFLHNREYQASLDDKLQYINRYDSLTGVYNRAYCEVKMEALDTKEHLPVSVIIGDLNNLKLINDIFGHAVGDEMIIETAKIMKTSAKEQVVGRWGGDEFVIVLPKKDHKQALKIVNHIKEATGKIKNDLFPINISLGTATKESTGESLSETVKLADMKLYKHKFKESTMAKKSLVEFFKKMLFEKDIETREHLLHVQELAHLLGRKMNLSPKELEELSLVAFFHDIGKVSIPQHILHKPDKLSPEEWETMQRHSEIGYRILTSSDELVHIAQPVLSHHEKWDGSGYPQNLKGKEIPFLARIIAIADAYDAMIQHRVYKKALSKEEALKEIKRCAGTHFDPHIAMLFIETMKANEPKHFQEKMKLQYTVK